MTGRRRGLQRIGTAAVVVALTIAGFGIVACYQSPGMQIEAFSGLFRCL